MTIERLDDNIAFICDTCDDVLETGEDVFEEALREMKDAGWKAKHVGVWEHTCDSCLLAETADDFGDET